MSRIKRNSVSQVNIETEAFIYEVQQRPALWDLTSEDYTDTAKKKKAWEEIVESFYDKDAALKYSDKDFCSQLQKKWKNLRDCYSRELKIRRRSGSENRKTSAYIYFDQLSFLERVIIPKISTLTEEPIEGREDESISTSTNASTTSTKRRKIVKLTTYEKPQSSGSRTTFEETSFQKDQEDKEPEVDCDRMFLLSLLDPLKQIPEYARFGVKRKLMELLDNELQIHLQTINPQITLTDTDNFIT